MNRKAEDIMRGLERYYLHCSRRPKWVNMRKVNDIYKESKRRGPDWHVDHIVPLISPRVCGLHWEGNLAIVHGAENMRKGNHYWPDMWNEPLELNLDCCMEYQLRLFK